MQPLRFEGTHYELNKQLLQLFRNCIRLTYLCVYLLMDHLTTLPVVQIIQSGAVR
jgi:hypothetical protein